MITASDVAPLLVTAGPSFAALWEELESDDIHVDDDGKRLHYADAGSFAGLIVERFVAGWSDEVQAAFDVIERLHVEGDDYVQELATIGYLEDIQNAAARHPGCAPRDLERFLGAESRRWWRGLDAFWSGGAARVTARDE